MLDTWIYHYLDHPVIDQHTSCDQPCAGMTFDEIVKAVLDLHSEAVILYRSLASRAEIPEAQDLRENLRGTEEQHGRLRARQANSIRDL